MTKSDKGGWVGRTPVPYGKRVEYKFLVDGEWQFNPDFPTTRDWRGIINNYLMPPIEADAKGQEVYMEPPTPVVPGAYGAEPETPTEEEPTDEAKKQANLAEVIKESAEHVTQLATSDIPQVVDEPAPQIALETADQAKALPTAAVIAQETTDQAKALPIADAPAPQIAQETSDQAKALPIADAPAPQIAQETSDQAKALPTAAVVAQETSDQAKALPTAEVPQIAQETTDQAKALPTAAVVAQETSDQAKALPVATETEVDPPSAGLFYILTSTGW